MNKSLGLNQIWFSPKIMPSQQLYGVNKTLNTIQIP